MGRLGLVGPLGLVILAPLGTSLGLVGGVTFARRGREIALRSLTCEENLIYFTSPTHSSLRVWFWGHSTASVEAHLCRQRVWRS